MIRSALSAAGRALGRIAAHLSRGLRREDGTASMEFVIIVPVILTIFMSSFECGLLMTREILLEESVDMTMRELRLGHYPAVTNVLLKQEICSRTLIFPNCESNIKIQLDRIDTTTWAVPSTAIPCVNNNTPAEPVTTPNTGQENDMMLVRVCVSLPAMFPGMGLALSMTTDELGNYSLEAASAFVVEPS
ncbi:pilus assembly protein [bacterium]|nr:pilus assembly protein [bacterium]